MKPTLLLLLLCGLFGCSKSKPYYHIAFEYPREDGSFVRGDATLYTIKHDIKTPSDITECRDYIYNNYAKTNNIKGNVVILSINKL